MRANKLIAFSAFALLAVWALVPGSLLFSRRDSRPPNREVVEVRCDVLFTLLRVKKLTGEAAIAKAITMVTAHESSGWKQLDPGVISDSDGNRYRITAREKTFLITITEIDGTVRTKESE